jgi:TetR/AcrR family transcriptional regulator, fatty acid metabolism regulator protein
MTPPTLRVSIRSHKEKVLGSSKDTRRDQVTEAALKVIGKSGMTGLTTAALAKEAGMSEANLYRHFANKQEIISETLKKIQDGLRGNVEAVMMSTSAPVQRLREIFRLHLRFVAGNEGIPRLVFSDEIHASEPGLRSRLFETISSYAAALERIVEQGKREGTIKSAVDPRATALTFIGMIQVTILRTVLSGFALSMEDEGLELWKNFESCIGG